MLWPAESTRWCTERGRKQLWPALPWMQGRAWVVAREGTQRRCGYLADAFLFASGQPVAPGLQPAQAPSLPAHPLQLWGTRPLTSWAWAPWLCHLQEAQVLVVGWELTFPLPEQMLCPPWASALTPVGQRAEAVVLEAQVAVVVVVHHTTHRTVQTLGQYCTQTQRHWGQGPHLPA